MTQESKKLFKFISIKIVGYFWVFRKRIYTNINCLSQWNFPVDTGGKLNVHKTFRRRPEDVLDVFWTSYVRSIYVLCLLGLVNLAPSSRLITNKQESWFMNKWIIKWVNLLRIQLNCWFILYQVEDRHPTWVGYLTWVRSQQNGEFQFLKTNRLYKNEFILSKRNIISTQVRFYQGGMIFFPWKQFLPGSLT